MLPTYIEIEKQKDKLNESFKKFDSIINNKEIPFEKKFGKLTNYYNTLPLKKLNQNYDTNIFTNDKDSNNVKYIGSYPTNPNLSRKSNNNNYKNINGISYGPTLF